MTGSRIFQRPSSSSEIAFLIDSITVSVCSAPS
jgi:hypothetical protein